MKIPLPRRTPPPRKIATVVKTQRITPAMQRVTLSGDSIVEFPQAHESAHIKLWFAPLGEQPDFDAFKAGDVQYTVRTYTVRHHRPQAQEIDIDFALHGSADDAKSGVANAWAQRCQEGDQVIWAGPGPIKLPTNTASWYAMAADMTGIPAATAALESLAEDATGWAVFEIPSPDDQQPVNAPQGIEVIWVVNADPCQPNGELLKRIQQLPWPNNDVGILVAGESKLVQEIRRHFIDAHDMPRKAMYTSPYWKIGLTEDEHQKAKNS